MTCFSPLPAYYSRFNPKTGKVSLVVLPRTEANLSKYSLRVPCGQDIGCRLEYSRQWALRCMHEASLYENNCFITLTYNDRFLPKNGNLNYDHWDKFLKRLRRKFEPTRIRFFMGAEYGTKSHRPHYHALLFNCDFPDKELFSIRNDYRLYTSSILDDTWNDPDTRESYGFASVGSLTFESAAYVARYMLKKVKGDDINLRYFARDDNNRLKISYDGEIFALESEKARMSRMPGLAKDWFDRYYKDVYAGNSDFVVVNGRKCRPPRYYDSLLERIEPEQYESIKHQRVVDAVKFSPNNTNDRLEVRRIVKEAQLSRLVRNLE